MDFNFILSCVYFFIPAYFTNMTPPLIKKAGLFNFLAKPVDFGKKMAGEPVLGSHKTWRGAIFGIIVGTLMSLLQAWLYKFQFFKGISFLDYSKIDVLLFGFLMSSGAVFGDLASAFAKRRLKKEPGQKFIPFDQTNYVVGAFIFFQAMKITFSSPPSLRSVFNLNLSVWFTVFILTFFLHILVNRIGYITGLHKAKW